MMNDRITATRGSVKIVCSPFFSDHGTIMSSSEAAARAVRAAAALASNTERICAVLVKPTDCGGVEPSSGAKLSSVRSRV
jgi:hypothetical protein